MFDHIRTYYTFRYSNMQAGAARVAVLEKLNALECWGDAE